MSKNIKFPPSIYGTTFEGVRSRKWKALHREKFVVDIGVHITGLWGICFFRYERVMNLSGVSLIIQSSKVSKVKEAYLDRIQIVPFSAENCDMKVYAVFDSKNDYAEWKLKNV